MRRALQVLLRGARLRCPCCGHGSLFRSRFTMYDACSACNERFERGEPGLSLGATYVNLALTLGVAALGLLVTGWLTSFPLVQQLTVWAIVSAFVPLVLHRVAKGLWTGLVFLGEGVYLEWPNL